MPKPDLRTSEANVAQAIEEAIAHFRQGRLAEAEKICTRVLKARSDHFDALHLAGLIKLQSGKSGAAYALIESALKVNPQSPEALANLGMALAALKRNEEALAAIDRALVLQPDNFETLNNRGNVLLKLNRPADALAAFDRVSVLAPRHPGARINRGNALAALERFAEAVAQYDAVLAVHPTHAETHCNRGNALSGQGRIPTRSPPTTARSRSARLCQGAHQSRRRAADAWPTPGGAGGVRQGAGDRQGPCRRPSQRGAHAADAGRLPPRLCGLRMALAADRDAGAPPQFWQAAVARRVSARAQDHSAARRAGSRRHHPVRALCVGLGEGGRQGGDRSAAGIDRSARTGRASLACTRPGRRYPPSTCIARWGACRALKTEPATIPANIPYLKASADRIAKWRERIERLPSPRIAIAWSGRAAHANDRNRSIALARLEPLLALDKVSFVSIQRELRDADGEVLARAPRLTHVGGDLGDFDDTAAVVSLVDLVISVGGGASPRRSDARPGFCCRSGRTGAGCSIAPTAPGTRPRGCSAKAPRAAGTAGSRG
jgi:tetratricopeptide (TPR) repeat protein